MKYVALLRGINVGGNCRVEMSRLKKVHESLGFSEVKTYINSGNVVFSAPKLSPNEMAAQIESAIAEEFGFAVRVLVLPHQQLGEIAEAIPPDWCSDKTQRTDVLFLWPEYASEDSLQLLTPRQEVDQLIFERGAIIWNLKIADYSRSAMSKFVKNPLYKNTTVRNANTVRKLASL